MLLPALGLFGLVGISAAIGPDIASLQAPPFVLDRVLVKFKPGAAASEIGAAHRQARGRALRTISGIGVHVVQVPAGSVLAKVGVYNANPNVEYAEPDYYRMLVIPNEEPGPTLAGGENYFEEQWYLNNTGQLHTRVEQTPSGPVLTVTQGTVDADIDAPEGWDLSQGLETTNPIAYNTPKVAVLDSGADCNTLELQGKCVEQVNLVGLDPSVFGLDICSPSEPACDNFGHGTFVASELGANTNNGEGIAGAAWNTSFGVFKVCYQELVTDGINVFLVGLCPVSASAQAITLAASDQVDAGGSNLVRSQYHVITMSYGSDLIQPDGTILPTSPPNTECDAVLYAWNNGVVVVAGAGNNGDTNKFYPAACTDDPVTGTGQSTVIAVAATDHDDNRAAFSTYSLDADDWVSLSAPGEAIVGVLPDAHCSLEPGTDTCVNWWDGTSMSTPLVAAAAALVWTDLYQLGSIDASPAPAGCTVGGTPCNQVVRQRLESGADEVGALGQDLQQWTRHGRLSIVGALTAKDTDGDDVLDPDDNCRDDPNPGQEDNDEDGVGDLCDDDDDNDGMTDQFENDNNLDPFDPIDAGHDGDHDGLTNLEEFNASTDPNDPDSDGDGIIDGLDRDPAVASNVCTGADAVLQNQTITSEVTCAASSSISVESTVVVEDTGDLELISPTVEFKPNFGIDGKLSVKSTNPSATVP